MDRIITVWCEEILKVHMQVLSQACFKFLTQTFFPTFPLNDVATKWDKELAEITKSYSHLKEVYKECQLKQLLLTFETNKPTEEEVAEVDCLITYGFVTYVGSESGLIDQNYHFDRCDGPAELRVGDFVKYLAIRDEPRAPRELKVLKIYSRVVKDENSWTKKQLQHRVTSRNGRQIVANDGDFRFHLDEVETKFAPAEGDLIYLSCHSAYDTEESRLTEVVDKVTWVSYKSLLGTVTDWDPGSGIGLIGTDVFFNRDACTHGYNPQVGDYVAADAIESFHCECSWRVMCVVLVESNKESTSKSALTQRDVEFLCRSKFGMGIFAETFSFEKVERNCSAKDITVELRNNGATKQCLLFGKLHMFGENSQVRPRHPVGKTYILPGATSRHTFSCKGTFLGPSREIFVFRFKNFNLGCVFNINVYQKETSAMETPSSSSERKPMFYHGLGMERNQNVLCGERPIQPPKFIERRLLHYNVPSRFWEIYLTLDGVLATTSLIQADIEALTPCLKRIMDFSSYSDRFHALLFLEELDAMIKLRRYKMERVQFYRKGEYLSLDVPGLDEKRPSLLVGDIVIASQPWRHAHLSYEGFVHKTLRRSILLKFNQNFHISNISDQYNVEFKFGRTAIRRQHAAIDLAIRHLGANILFPSKLDLKEPQIQIHEAKVEGDRNYYYRSKVNGKLRKVKWLNESLNEFQREAIVNILIGEARPLPYIIFGPPGTGKTITLVELILKILELLPESRILIATPSNSSANLIAEKLIEYDNIQVGDLVRLVGYHVLDDGNLPSKLVPFCTTGDIKMTTGEDAKPSPIGKFGNSSNKNTLGRTRITIGTCIALGQLYTMGMEAGSFTHILVDEAAQSTEPEILVPLAFLNPTCGQIILAGDPMQLGPVVGSNLANRYGLAEPYLDRLLHRFPYQSDRASYPERDGLDPRLITCLLKNYRTLPEILALPNKLFYESRLLAQVSDKSGPAVEMLRKFRDFLPQRNPNDYPSPPAIVFHGVKGTNLQEAESPSWFNPEEVLIVMNYVQMLQSVGVHNSDVGIITPYRKQVQKMRSFYTKSGNMVVPKIGSVEEFQGQERKVIILSTVRSSSNNKNPDSDIVHSLGFVSSRKRLNVSLTRAQTLLVVVGNPHVLAQDTDWRATLLYCMKHSCYVGCDVPLDCMPAFEL